MSYWVSGVVMNSNQPKDKLAIAVSIVGLALGFYWMFTYSGPYRYLAEWQQKWLGWYAPKLTRRHWGHETSRPGLQWLKPAAEQRESRA
jgi:hypothetical protein